MERVYSVDEINSIAKACISAVEGNRIFIFSGNLGAGKTSLIKEMCKEWQIKDVVQSPTYGLVNTYETKDGQTIHHLDLYRTKNPQEVYESGITEILDSNAICLVEWPENIVPFLFENYVHIELFHEAPNFRKILLTLVKV
ncbi:MAG: tRNA (adenosine(37)-N6)-threonylcarbamoyltransferase complex ATPase subunit type 1 TsaE [Flavobacteriales bacterium]|nr:MAG: tRNA (adenosine(37)-N6)-threonylcarbamoyltransferase complex ATPase subunit type 1 TsaE [Flavobacteriales bacterium]